MIELTEQESKEMMRNLLYISIISADNDEYDEDIKQSIISRYNENKGDPDWWYVFEPLGEDREKYVKLMEAI